MNSKRFEFFHTQNINKKLHEYSAGVLPYQIENNKVYICLGKDKDGFWSDFGGKCDPKDRYYTIETAAREFYEESYGAFLSLEGIREHLSHEENFKVINSESLSGIRYFMFLLQIPKLEYSFSKFHCVYNYMKYINADYQYQEKVDLKWITLTELMYILDHPEQQQEIILKKVFRRTLLKNRNILLELKHKEELYF
jgi:hypothetical protein